jgi:hypothetical protein
LISAMTGLRRWRRLPTEAATAAPFPAIVP